MQPSPALKKVFLSQKLSTKPPNSDTPSPDDSPFDPNRLVRELLSLGNEKITPRIAETIGREVQAELKRRSASRWTAQMISEIVQFKLEEMGLIGIRPRRRRRADGLHYLELPRGLFASEEATEFLPPAGEGEFEPQEEGPHALGGYPLRRPPNGAWNDAAPSKPLPPRAVPQLSEAALKSLGPLFPETPAEKRGLEWEQVLARVAHEAARAETLVAGGSDPDVTEVEFFNVMANQEFFPHHPALLEAGDRNASGSFWVRVPLNSELRSQAEALELSRKLWQNSGSVLFDLDAEPGRTLSTPALERFLEAVETSVFQSSGAPAAVGFVFSADQDEAEAWVRLILSGRYCPKFSLQLRCKDLLLGGIEERQEKLRRVIQEAWRRGELNLLRSADARPGGGPDLGTLETCHLGTVNVSVLASGGEVDWIKLRRILHTAVHFLDNWTEAAPHASEEIARNARANRKIGIGVMGFAELLIKLGIPYDGEDAVILSEKLMRFIQQETAAASESLAESRGVFPNYPLSALPRRRRQATLTAIVPAPFLASVAGVTPGIDPLHAVPFPLLKQIGLRRGVWTAELEEDLLRQESVRQSSVAPKPLRRLFGIRSEVAAEWELKIQAGFQRFCDGAVGHRLALPETQDVAPLWPVLEQAQAGGISVLALRQNPELEELVLGDPPSPETTASAVAEPAPEPEVALPPEPLPLVPRPRPEVLSGTLRTIQTGCGPMTVTLAREGDKPFEVQARLGKSGSCASAQTEAISRLITLLLGVGVESRLVYEQLRGIRCPALAIDQGEPVLSCGDAISKVLARELGFAKSMPQPEAGAEPETPELPEKHFAEEEEITAIVTTDSIH